MASHKGLGKKVGRREFLSMAPALALVSQSNVSGKLAVEGGGPVRNSGLHTDYPGTQFYDDSELTELNGAYNSHSLFRFYGPAVPQKVANFERELAAFAGSKYALGVSSGTAALHCALTALGAGPGDEVILPAWTWHSCYTAILLTGALPVFAEVDDSLNIDPADVEARITANTKVIMAVHLFGAPADMGRIMKLAQARNLKVLEDAAQSFGGSYQGRRLGSIGHVGIYSFQIHKLITAGEGGAIVTDDPLLYERAIRFHDLGILRPVHRTILSEPQLSFFPGINYRMNEMTGAVMRAQLRKIETILAAQRRNAKFIRDRISNLPAIQLKRSHDPAGETGWTIDLLLPDRSTRDKFVKAMTAENVPMGAPSAATPLPPMPYIVNKAAPHPAWPTFNSKRGREIKYGEECCPRTLEICNRTATLTIGPKFSEADLNDAVTAITKVHNAILS